MITFDLLHPYLQEIIRRKEWDSFKPIQDVSIQHISKNTTDLLIVAPTASGKTEAAFLPVISNILHNPKPSVRILYVSPLKALINDQFSRVLELCKLTNITVTKWHGDADNSKKQKIVKNPEGILLITPESLEALLINKNEHIAHLFKYLDYVIIDEIHNFAVSERGVQLNSLLNRLQHSIDKTVQKIGLSATLDQEGIDGILSWLYNCSLHSEVKVIKEKDTKGLQGLIKSYIVKTDEHDIPIEISLSDDLFSILVNKKSLIFANNKNILELYCDELREVVANTHSNLLINIHHGSLSKEIREDTERQLKESNSIAVFCTNTLELGIDISSIDQIIFLQPPFSVSSMVQRLGRSGRSENSTKIFRFFLKRMDDINTDAKIETDVVQSVAMTELMLESWYEPLPLIDYDYSTYTHQLLSYLRITGGTHAVKLFNYLSKVCRLKMFGLTESNFILLLRSLKDKGIIYQDTANNISLDKLGERITEHYTFYATFSVNKEWRLVYNGTDIGTIPKLPLAEQIKGQHLLLAGKRWEIVEVIEETSVVLIKPSKFKKPLMFISSNQKIHRKIHEKMREIYQKKFVPSYADENTKNYLEQAFKQYNLACEKESNILFVLEGTIIQNTMVLILKYLNISSTRCKIGFVLSQNKKEVVSILKKIDWNSFDLLELVEKLPRANKENRKFDYLLPDEILDLSYIREWIDIEGAKTYIQEHL